MRSRDKRYNEPETEVWAACKRLTSQADWRPRPGSPFTHQRSVTWRRHPNTYLLTEYAKKAGWLGSRLVPCMFELSKLSKLNTDTGLRDYTRYEIIGDKVLASIDSKLPPAAALTEDGRASLEDEFTFVLQNRLGALDSVGILEIEAALGQANLDGVQPYAK